MLFGETAPIGNENVVSPLGFLRGAMCLNTNYKKPSGCCKKLRIDGYAHHAYTRKAGPTFVSDEPGRGQHRLARPAGRGARQGRHGRARSTATAAIYLTEFGIQSKPDPLAGVSLARQAEYLAIVGADRLRQPARQGVLAVPDARRQAAQGLAPSATRASRPACGRRRARRSRAYDAFILPLAATRYGSSDVLWGRVRPATGPTEVTIEHKIGRRQVEAADRAPRPAASYGFRTDHHSKQRYRVKWTRPDGATITGPPIRRLTGR